MLTLIASFVFLSFPLLQACPSDMLMGISGDPCYKLMSIPLPFLQAEYSCAQLGGHLASVDNSFLNGYLDNAAKNAFKNADSYWLGGSTLFIGNSWAWNDGMAMSYQNWAPGQPSSKSGSYAISVDITTGQWSSVSSEESKPYVCEVSMTNVNRRCPIGWEYSDFTQKCYKFAYYGSTNLPYFNYSTGQEICKNFSASANLVSVRDFDENTIVSAYALNLLYASQQIDCSKTLHMDCGILIGLYTDGTGNFKWIDGTPSNYTNWDLVNSQPDINKLELSVALMVGGDNVTGITSMHNTWRSVAAAGSALCEMASIPDKF